MNSESTATSSLSPDRPAPLIQQDLPTIPTPQSRDIPSDHDP
jgi:hypothetical protein